MKQICFVIYFILSATIVNAEDGYRLWLRYDKIDNPAILQQYRDNIAGIQFSSPTPTLTVAKEELLNGLQGLLGKKIIEQKTVAEKYLVVGNRSTSTIIQTFLSSANFDLG